MVRVRRTAAERAAAERAAAERAAAERAAGRAGIAARVSGDGDSAGRHGAVSAWRSAGRRRRLHWAAAGAGRRPRRVDEGAGALRKRQRATGGMSPAADKMEAM